MYTLLLEIQSTTNSTWYNPAVPDCCAYPRTNAGIARAIKKFYHFCKEHADSITGARVVLYKGHFEYWKRNMLPMSIETIY